MGGLLSFGLSSILLKAAKLLLIDRGSTAVGGSRDVDAHASD
jgi:hypothetical protein